MKHNHYMEQKNWLHLVFWLLATSLPAQVHLGPNQPYPNLQSAHNAGAIQPGDTVYLHAGSYAGYQGITALNGTASAWIVITRFQNDPIDISGGWQFISCHYLRFQNLNFKGNAAHPGRLFSVDNNGSCSTQSTHIAVDHCTFSNTTDAAAVTAFKFGGVDHFEVTNCSFTDIPACEAMDFNVCHDGLIRQNRFENCLSGGHIKGGSSNITMERNLFVNASAAPWVAYELGGDTGAQFYCPGDNFEVKNLNFYANIIVGGYRGVALSSARDCRVVNNTFYNCGQATMRFLTTSVLYPTLSGNMVENNLFAFGNSAYFNGGLQPAGAATFSHNIYYSLINQVFNGPYWDTPDLNAIKDPNPMNFGAGTPMFTNGQSLDFHLAETSPAIGSGTSQTGPDFDFFGNPFSPTSRSIGAIEAAVVDPIAEWDSIKNNAQPIVAPGFVSQYQTPVRLTLSDYGWEDGLQISPDGLNLYALYAPADLFSWFGFISSNPGLPICSTLGNSSFIRPYAKNYGMDLSTNFFGCDTALNIDIVYAHRNSTADTFQTWILSDVARAGLIEAGPFPLYAPDNPALVDHFLFTGAGDIWMINQTTANPAGISGAIRLPHPINPLNGEFVADNPILKRLNSSDTLLLVYEKYLPGTPRDFMYAISYDNGASWETPVVITTVNNNTGNIEHPQLYSDASGTYLYYSVNYDIYRSRQSAPNDWDSWVNPEAVILKGNALSIGEPSLTADGDIAFVVAYENTSSANPADRFDSDPWLVKHIPNAVGTYTGAAASAATLQPNPARDLVTLQWRHASTLRNLTVLDVQGRAVLTIQEPKNTQKIPVASLKAGLYLICAMAADGTTWQGKLVVEH